MAESGGGMRGGEWIGWVGLGMWTVGWACGRWVEYVDGGLSMWITGAVKGRPGHI